MDNENNQKLIENSVNNHLVTEMDNNHKRESLKITKINYRKSIELELYSEKCEREGALRRPSILKKQVTVTSEDFKEYSDLFRDMPLTDETTCGIWFLRGSLLQKFANKKAYVFIYGLLGTFFGATYAYFNGTITTIEKRYKIPSRTTGLISVGNDMSQVFLSMGLAYYAGKQHRPRCMALGMYTVVIFCFMNALPHFLYGPGEDSFQLTLEYGGLKTNQSFVVREKTLCHPGGAECIDEVGSFAPQAILFAAQLISGVGGTLYYSLGVTYMDDNIQKSKTPALISLSYFLRMLGPAIGYALASFCLKMYISPELTPTITNNDPRWLGAWWLGWIILGVLMFIFSSLIGLFPKVLPRAAVRKVIVAEKNRLEQREVPEIAPPSFRDMVKTYKRLFKNKTYVCNNLSSIFYCFGYMPYWIFMPKYIETQYKQSASTSSFVTGTVGLVFSAIGILTSGAVITKCKPSARYLAGWNVIVSITSVMGIISYIYLGCDGDTVINSSSQMSNTSLECNLDCHCDFTPYSPVCSENQETFISPCHAGCMTSYTMNDSRKTKVFQNCSCIKQSLELYQTTPFRLTKREVTNSLDDQTTTNMATTKSLLLGPTFTTTEHTISTTAQPKRNKEYFFGQATQGSCPYDCAKTFYTFLGVVCLLKFMGATGRASNFLVGVRCVEEDDKPASMGLSMSIIGLFAFIPSPVVFGYILDMTCLVWGKTCAGTGNCWLYDGPTLRYVMNTMAVGFVSLGTVFDAGVWYYVKDLKIFDEEVEVKVVGTGEGDD